MKSRIFKTLCFMLVVICLCGLNINAVPPSIKLRLRVEAEEYETFFADFLSNEEHEYRKYTYKDLVNSGDPSHFVPYLKAYGLPVLISVDGDTEQRISSSCTAIANISSGTLKDTELEYGFKISETEGYIVRIFFHGDAEKDYYESISNKKRLKFLKKKFFKDDINRASVIKDTTKNGYIKYENVNIGNEVLPCRVIYTESNSGGFSIEAFFIIGNYCVGIQSFGNEGYDAIFDSLEKIKVDIIPYSELIKTTE